MTWDLKVLHIVWDEKNFLNVNGNLMQAIRQYMVVQ